MPKVSELVSFFDTRYDKISQLLKEASSLYFLYRNVVFGGLSEGPEEKKNKINKAIEKYTLAAELGSDQAMYELGNIYNNDNSNDNIDKAMFWFNEARDRGNIYAFNAYGILFSNSEEITETDFEMALDNFNNAYARGYIRGIINLAQLYESVGNISKKLEILTSEDVKDTFDAREELYNYHEKNGNEEKAIQVYVEWLYRVSNFNISLPQNFDEDCVEMVANYYNKQKRYSELGDFIMTISKNPILKKIFQDQYHIGIDIAELLYGMENEKRKNKKLMKIIKPRLITDLVNEVEEFL
jgi:hypothetical protein